MVLEYINKSKKGIPIFIEEIKEYVRNQKKVRNNRIEIEWYYF